MHYRPARLPRNSWTHESSLESEVTLGSPTTNLGAGLSCKEAELRFLEALELRGLHPSVANRALGSVASQRRPASCSLRRHAPIGIGLMAQMAPKVCLSDLMRRWAARKETLRIFPATRGRCGRCCGHALRRCGRRCGHVLRPSKGRVESRNNEG